MKAHVSLNVSEVERSVEFYGKMFGVSPSKRKNDYAKFDITNPPLNLTLNRANFERGGSLSHLGLEVENTDEVLKMTKLWNENGLLTLSERQIDCCYALQDKTWISDPDGNRWEVFTVLEDTDGGDISASTCCASPQKNFSINREARNSCC